MQKSVSIAPLLWNHQVSSTCNIKITHGKGRKGIIIRYRRISRMSYIKTVLFWGRK